MAKWFHEIESIDELNRLNYDRIYMNAGVVKHGDIITIETPLQTYSYIALDDGYETVPDDTLRAWVNDELRIDFKNVARD